MATVVVTVTIPGTVWVMVKVVLSFGNGRRGTRLSYHDQDPVLDAFASHH